MNNKDVRIHILDNDDPGNSPFDESTLLIVPDPDHANQICNTNGLCHTATVTITVTN